MNSSATARLDHSDDIAATPAAAPEKLTYSVAEAAVLLGVSRPTVYRLLARWILIPIPGLRHKRIPKKQVRRLVEAHIRTARFAPRTESVHQSAPPNSVCEEPAHQTDEF